jgi:hypothetical protein
LLLIPVHWLLLSLAAWRALYQLVRDPYRWEKTEHGLAQTSRRARLRLGRAVFPNRKPVPTTAHANARIRVPSVTHSPMKSERADA